MHIYVKYLHLTLAEIEFLFLHRHRTQIEFGHTVVGMLSHFWQLKRSSTKTYKTNDGSRSPLRMTFSTKMASQEIKSQD